MFAKKKKDEIKSITIVLAVSNLDNLDELVELWERVKKMNKITKAFNEISLQECVERNVKTNKITVEPYYRIVGIKKHV